MENVIASAWRAEEALLTKSVRGDSARLSELLAPDFYEIGQSGRRWSREETVTSLVADTEPERDAELNEREATLVSADTVLLSYRLQYGASTSRRSSLWRWDGQSVRCLFHQGTPTPS
jgi:hypothetical protein